MTPQEALDAIGRLCDEAQADRDAWIAAHPADEGVAWLVVEDVRALLAEVVPVPQPGIDRDNIVKAVRRGLVASGIGYAVGLQDEGDLEPYVDGNPDLGRIADEVLALVRPVEGAPPGIDPLQFAGMSHRDAYMAGIQNERDFQANLAEYVRSAPTPVRSAIAKALDEGLPADALDYEQLDRLADAVLAAVQGAVRPVEGVVLTPEAVLDAIRECAPPGMELRTDPARIGTEDPQDAAYVEGVRTAYEAVRALAARLEGAGS